MGKVSEEILSNGKLKKILLVFEFVGNLKTKFTKKYSL